MDRLRLVWCLRVFLAVMMLMMGNVSGNEFDSEGDQIFNDLEVRGTRGLVDIRQGFEDSWQDFIRAEEDLKNARNKVNNINDDIRKAEDIHTQVSHLSSQLLNDNSAYF
jgi:hypothetical protein